jgi:hypothetical protein
VLLCTWRVNTTLPAICSAKPDGGLNVSPLVAAALAEELNRLAKIHELDAYLDELDNELSLLVQPGWLFQ